MLGAIADDNWGINKVYYFKLGPLNQSLFFVIFYSFYKNNGQ